MQSRNPILRNGETFNGKDGPSDPRTWRIPAGTTLEEPMTIDSVVSRTVLAIFQR